MTIELPTSASWAQRCNADGEFRLAARQWQGGLVLSVEDQTLSLAAVAGQMQASSVSSAQDEPGWVEYQGSNLVWEQMLAAPPARFFNDLMANISQNQGIVRIGDPIRLAQTYAAVMRAIELLRPDSPSTNARLDHDQGDANRFDAPLGRYVHLELAGHDYRLYFEEAGQGIPLLLQHTAGCHSSQWRHLFEMPEITDHFRLIAYDLPFHGKSLPPPGKKWWQEPYLLRGEFLRSVPLQLSDALGLVRPVFMGCSVGGLLALDLAHKHPERFRAVVSIEGALNINGHMSQLGELWHPQISSEYKARLMEGLVSPTSPEAYRKETGYVYASGWPPVFLGDLQYYMEDYNLASVAATIDTEQIDVHILSGEYDYSATSEMGLAAHEAIPGSTWCQMRNLGHFPMSENPQAFVEYLQPILQSIRASSG